MDIAVIVTHNVTDDVSLVDVKPYVIVPYVSLLVVIAVVGTFGNLLILCSVCSAKGSRTNGNLFIANLAFSDLTVTSFVNPLAVLGALFGQYFYLNNDWLCVSVASICTITCVVSLLTIALIGANRYVFICHRSLYESIFVHRLSALIVVLTWVAGTLMDLPVHLGWSRHAFDHKIQNCLWDRSTDHSFVVFYVSVGMICPFFVILFFYGMIFTRIRSSKKNLFKFDQNSRRRKVLSSTIRQAQTMFYIFLAFTVCWTPYVLVLLLDVHDQFAIEVHLVTSLIAHSHASLNFVIYGVMNSQIREIYKQMIRNKLCCCLQSGNSLYLVKGFIDISLHDTGRKT